MKGKNFLFSEVVDDGEEPDASHSLLLHDDDAGSCRSLLTEASLMNSACGTAQHSSYCNGIFKS